MTLQHAHGLACQGGDTQSSLPTIAPCMCVGQVWSQSSQLWGLL
jgi:hypothetical protein